MGINCTDAFNIILYVQQSMKYEHDNALARTRWTSFANAKHYMYAEHMYNTLCYSLSMNMLSLPPSCLHTDTHLGVILSFHLSQDGPQQLFSLLQNLGIFAQKVARDGQLHICLWTKQDLYHTGDWKPQSSRVLWSCNCFEWEFHPFCFYRKVFCCAPLTHDKQEQRRSKGLGESVLLHPTV